MSESGSDISEIFYGEKRKEKSGPENLSDISDYPVYANPIYPDYTVVVDFVISAEVQ